MKTEPSVATREQLAGLRTKVDEMHQRTIAASAPLKARYAALLSQLRMLEPEIRNLDEDWEPPK
ncbi:MAG TPA: hypothetical protein VFE51_20910 [Verrucomicrobiae bacterium]|nr:hypothetical protein [Verrucomicrobiae bacterium]